MKGRQAFCVVPLILLGCRCGGKTNDSRQVHGNYTIEATCVNALSVPRDQPGIAMLMGAGIRLRAKPVVFTIAPTEGATKARITDDMGCSLIGDFEDGKVTARNTACDPMSPEAQLSRSGIESQLKLTFSLDVGRGKLHDFNTNSIVWAGGAREKNYFTCEGHILDDTPMRPGYSQVMYDGRTRYPYEQEAKLGCKAVPTEPNGYTNGTLLLHYGETRSELVIYEEGVGCTVTAKTDDGVVFRADGVDCQLGKTGITELGVTSRHFDTYVLDFGAKTWNHSSTILRNDGNGGTMIQCQVVTTQITGELPK